MRHVRALSGKRRVRDPTLAKNQKEVSIERNRDCASPTHSDEFHKLRSDEQALETSRYDESGNDLPGFQRPSLRRRL